MMAAASSMYVTMLDIQRNNSIVNPALQYTEPINVFFRPIDSTKIKELYEIGTCFP